MTPDMPIASLVAAIRQPAFFYGLDGRIAEANDLAEAIAGAPLKDCSAATVVGLFRFRRPDGTTLSGAELPASRALAGEESVDLPFAVTAPDGRVLHVLVTASPVLGGAGTVGALVVWHDVSQREGLREHLAESEAKYRNLVELSPDAILIHQDGTIVFANPAAVELTGVAGPGEIVGRPVLERVHPCARGDVEWNISADLRGEESPLTTVDLLRPDGTTVTVQGRGAMIPFRCRPAVQVVLRDVTEEKRAETALRESEERHALLLTLGDRLRELSGVREITAAASELLGRHLGVNGVVYCEVDADGTCATVRADWTDGTLPAVAESYRMNDLDVGERYRQGLVYRVDDIAAGRDTAEAAASAPLIRASLGVPIRRSGRLAAILAVHSATPRAWTDTEVELVRQIGDRAWSAVGHVRAEDALRRSEERLRLALESAEIGIWDRDLATDRVTLSPEYLRRYGLEAESETSYSTWERLIHPDDRALVEAGRRATIETGAPLDLEFRVTLPTGEGLWVQFKGRGVPDEQGSPSRVIGVLIDVTGRKEAELALGRYADDLRASQDQLRDVIDATGAGFYHISLDAAQGTLSRRGAEILGFKTPEMPSLLDIVSEAQVKMHPDDIDGVLSSFLTFVGA
ncbi:MAG: PAS domain S-box protein, partial [Methanospirillum sp.]